MKAPSIGATRALIESLTFGAEKRTSLDRRTGRKTQMGGANERGFTLLELMVTLAVAVVLLTFAIPSYRSMVTRNSLASNVNDLVGSLNYARSEAVSRGTTVYICPSTDQTSCRDDPKDVWSDGWIIYAPTADSSAKTAQTNNLLRVHSATGSGFTLVANINPPLEFNADGFAVNFGTFTGTTESGQTTLVKVATTGRIQTATTP